MKSVGVKSLKDNLSSYLRLVKNGEVVLVTDHNEVIAEIKKPVADLNSNDSKFNQFLLEQASLGRLTLAKRNKSSLKKPTNKIRVKQSDWKKIYEETRADR